MDEEIFQSLPPALWPQNCRHSDVEPSRLVDRRRQFNFLLSHLSSRISQPLPRPISQPRNQKIRLQTV
jgi:hypothetical protein